MISVIIPAYNCKNVIGDTIDSVLTQTRVDLIDEIIVINDGSTDGTGDFVRETYPNSLVSVLDKTNGGVSSARNEGIKRARNEWIALLDSDDVWLPTKIEKQWKQISINQQIKFIGCNRNKENLRYGTKIGENIYKLDLNHILIKMWPHTSTALIHKSVFETVGYFNENQKYAEDGELWNRIALHYPLYYVSESLEIAGDNKVTFGVSGLSANLKAMHEGNVSNIRILHSNNEIGRAFYIFLIVYYNIKYIRRICITKYGRFIKKYEKNINIYQ
ncbi:glycosyltransferase family 2 protein [Faecalibaculum rodentium]|uniref:Glycosyltransferase 2-like domain-containing protein n=1 Tax=Faecalibaculum rodentium TaxID=1702221 RepID=A0A1Q9YHS5_9FIRM|nr:glycosyltransferase [Faecalibaculum rodentium]OLU43726.1 hypothetical protein BO223_10910 [Faecalibaculum rodentium]